MFFLSRFNDGIAGMCIFLCKNSVCDRQKSTHIFVSDNIILFHMSFMTVTKGKSLTRNVVVVVFVFNVPPTAEVIWRRGHGLKSHPTDW